MKKMINFAVVIIAMLSFSNAFANDDRQINFNQLPKKAQAFVKQYYSLESVASVWVDDDDRDKDYKVVFHNGDEVEFHTNGDWDQVKSRSGKVPEKLLTAGIKSFLSKNHAGAGVYKLDKKRSGYEVELSNGKELKFDARGNFLRYDD